MRRRDVMGMLGVAAAPPRAVAQAKGKIWRIAHLLESLHLRGDVDGDDDDRRH